MGWGDVISIGLGLGNMAINSSNASKLEQMKLQQAGEALYREFITFMRNGLFNLKQTAESVLASEAESPLKAAGAMRILEYQLSDSGITPDMFSELPDKEYAAATFKLVKGNSSRLYASLPAAEQSQVDQLVQHMRQLPEYRYHLENADNVNRLREAQSTVENGGNPRVEGCILPVGLVFFGMMFLALGDIGGLFWLGAIIGAIVLAVKFSGKRGEVNRAKNTIKELEGNVDLERFRVVEKQFETIDQTRQAQKQSEQYIENFFGDYTLLQDGWRP